MPIWAEPPSQQSHLWGDHPPVEENQKLERRISEVKTSMVEDKRLDTVWHLCCIRKAIKYSSLYHRKQKTKNRVSLSLQSWEAISGKPKMSSWYLYLSFTCLRQALGDKRKGGTELTNSFIKFIGHPLYDCATPELEIRDYKRLYPAGKCDLNYWPKRAVESKEKSLYSPPKFFLLFDKNVGLSFLWRHGKSVSTHFLSYSQRHKSSSWRQAVERHTQERISWYHQVLPTPVTCSEAHAHTAHRSLYPFCFLMGSPWVNRKVP